MLHCIIYTLPANEKPVTEKPATEKPVLDPPVLDPPVLNRPGNFNTWKENFAHEIYKRTSLPFILVDLPSSTYLDKYHVIYDPNHNEDTMQDFFNIFEGKIHNEFGPAVEYSNGDKEWYLNGKLSKADGPASVYHDGKIIWYLDGLMHRIDGPAYIDSNGTEIWYFNGKMHREYDLVDAEPAFNSPAYIGSDGIKRWDTFGHIDKTEYPDGYWVAGRALDFPVLAT